MEYTEIRPIRPNQSVVLAGLGVQGRGLGRCRKDRSVPGEGGEGAAARKACEVIST